MDILDDEFLDGIIDDDEVEPDELVVMVVTVIDEIDDNDYVDIDDDEVDIPLKVEVLQLIDDEIDDTDIVEVDVMLQIMDEVDELVGVLIEVDIND